MWEPQPLTSLWASTACYRDNLQCQQHNECDIKCVPHNDGKPEHVCALVCLNNKHVYKSVRFEVSKAVTMMIIIFWEMIIIMYTKLWNSERRMELHAREVLKISA
jgi:hypothetical protein